MADFSFLNQIKCDTVYKQNVMKQLLLSIDEAQTCMLTEPERFLLNVRSAAEEVCLFWCAQEQKEPEKMGLHKTVSFMKNSGIDIDQVTFKKLVFIERTTCIGVKCDDTTRRNLMEFIFELCVKLYQNAGLTGNIPDSIYEIKKGHSEEMPVTDEWKEQCSIKIAESTENTRTKMKTANITLQATGLAAEEAVINVRKIVSRIEESLKNSSEEELSNLDSFKMCMTQLANQMGGKIGTTQNDSRRIYKNIFGDFKMLIVCNENNSMKRDDIYTKVTLLTGQLTQVYRKKGDQENNIAHFVDKIADGIERFVQLNQKGFSKFDDKTKGFFEQLKEDKQTIIEMGKNFRFRVTDFETELEKNGVDENPELVKSMEFDKPYISADDKSNEGMAEAAAGMEIDSFGMDDDLMAELAAIADRSESKPEPSKVQVSKTVKNKPKVRKPVTFREHFLYNAFPNPNVLFWTFYGGLVFLYVLIVVLIGALFQEIAPVDNAVLAKVFAATIFLGSCHGWIFAIIGFLYYCFRLAGTFMRHFKVRKLDIADRIIVVLTGLFSVCMIVIGLMLYLGFYKTYSWYSSLSDIIVAKSAEDIIDVLTRVFLRII